MALTEGQHTGEFLINEGQGTVSRSNVTVTVAANTKLEAGTVLAKLTATGKYVVYDNAGSDGSEVADAILWEEADNTDGDSETDFSRAVIDWNAEVRKASLQWATGLVAGDKTAAYADLAAKGIKAR